jgi:CDP-diacylglycerol--serine O-phosphatidyltransferase
MSRHLSMIRNFHASDVVTLANGGCGAWAIFLAMAHAGGAGIATIYLACGALVAALIFDTLDGRIARWRHQASALGRELDSLADVVSFGAAPAALAYALGLRTPLDQLCLVYFVACGIGRLARYNVTAEQLSADTGKVTYFEGTPITTSLLLVFLLTGMAAAGRTGAYVGGGAIEMGRLSLHWLALLFVLSGSLMVSKTLRIPKP